MALQLTEVNGYVRLPNGVDARTARFEFRLTSYDTDAPEDTLVVPEVVVGTLDDNAYLEVELWPNELGERNTYYRVRVIVPQSMRRAANVYDLGGIVVPEAGPVDINDLLIVGPPANVTVGEYLAQLQGFVAQAEAAAASLDVQVFETYADALDYSDGNPFAIVFSEEA